MRLTTVLRDLAGILRALPGVEWGRRTGGPRPLLERARSKGGSSVKRSQPARADLRRVIGWMDRHLPGEASCYRRALLEISLDAGAAEEPLHFGLKVPGGPRSGHVWLGDTTGASYDVRFDL